MTIQILTRKDFRWAPTVHKQALMFFNTTLCKGDISLKADLETVVVDPAEFMTVGDSLSRAVCEKSSLHFKSSELAAAQLLLSFSDTFDGLVEGRLEWFKDITGYRVDQLTEALTFLRPFDRATYLTVQDAFPDTQNVSADDMIYMQSRPFHLG